MKKKIILALTACLFASGSIINIHLAQNNHNLDVSLADISVMAQATNESDVSCSAGGPGSISCSYSAEVWGIVQTCSVGCQTGYYACCGLQWNMSVSCSCIPNS